MEVKHYTRVVFTHLLFVVRVAEECEEYAVCAQRRLDDVGNVFFVGYGVDVGKILARRFHMLIEVVVGAIRNAPKLAPAEREFIFEVGRCLGVEAKFFFFVVAEFEVFVSHAEVEQPLMAEVLPICKPFEIGAGLAEKFKFHLFKFTDAEDEVAGCDFVAEALADLTDAERYFFTSCALHVFEVDEYALRGFGAEIDGGCRIFRHADKSFEHKVEFSHARKVAVATNGAGDFVLDDILFHLLVAPTRDVDVKAVFEVVFFDEVVGAMTGFAGFAIHQRIGKTADMSACLPSGGVHDDRAVKTYVVGIFDNEFFPPSLLDVVFELDAERAVVPRV